MNLQESQHIFGNRWNLSMDLTRWLIGVEWEKKAGWVEINAGCFTLTVWWRKEGRK